MTVLAWLESALGLIVLAGVQWDLFATIVLPRTVNPKLRVSARVLRRVWPVWAALGRVVRSPERRLTFLAVYGPLTNVLLMLLWGGLTILAFTLVYHGLVPSFHAEHGSIGFGTLFYMSASTFLTLGLGDVTTTDPLARTFVIIEAGAGIVFLSLIISYLPVLHQAYVEREVGSSLVHSRAGHPPTAVGMLRRYVGPAALDVLRDNLREAERWLATILQSHISHPVLVFYRAQHVGESWVAALTTVLDSCVLLIVVGDGLPAAQARLTYSIGRRVLVDLSRALDLTVLMEVPARLPEADVPGLLTTLRDAGVADRDRPDAAEQLRQLAGAYEPYLEALSGWLQVPSTAWYASEERR
jgi:hypothetical protein